MPAPEPLADDIGGISAWQPSAIRPWLCAAGKRRRIWQVSLSFLQSSAPATAQNPQPISAAPYTAERAVTRFSPSSCIACSLLCASHPSVSPLHIHLMSFHQRCTLLLFPSSHPLTPLCISTHTPSGFDAGYRLFLHYGWLLFSRRPFRHPALSHLFYFLPPISLLGPLLHLFSTLGIHWFMSLWCSKAKEGEGSRRYITVTLQNAFPSLRPSLPFPFCLANMLA